MTNFTNTIEKGINETLVSETFTTRNEAVLSAKKLVAEFKLKKHAGHTVNYSEGVELIRNYN